MTTFLTLGTGVLLAGALVAFVAALVPATPELSATLKGLAEQEQDARPVAAPQPKGFVSLSDRVGAWLHRRSPLPLSDRQRRDLELRNRSVAEFYGDRAALALTGLLLPGLLAAFCSALFDLPVAVPGIAGVVGAGVGFWVPDLLLRGGSRGARSDAGEALVTYIDLVTLERLANASATQALHNAANLSDTVLFRQIRGALERARLEQQPPYAELRRLASHLDLPELGDIADVMQMDEAGAALSGALRARARELRDAHLTSAQNEANVASEGMTIYMSIPALLFGLIFMVPPLMRIAFG
jgi:tight adherence protein C